MVGSHAPPSYQQESKTQVSAYEDYSLPVETAHQKAHHKYTKSLESLEPKKHLSKVAEMEQEADYNNEIVANGSGENILTKESFPKN